MIRLPLMRISKCYVVYGLCVFLSSLLLLHLMVYSRPVAAAPYHHFAARSQLGFVSGETTGGNGPAENAIYSL